MIFAFMNLRHFIPNLFPNFIPNHIYSFKRNSPRENPFIVYTGASVLSGKIFVLLGFCVPFQFLYSIPICIYTV